MTCPNCDADATHFETRDWWQNYHPTGMTREVGERLEEDTHKWQITCTNCDTTIVHDQTADSAEEAIGKFVTCNHENRTNSLEMSCRPSDHLDTYRVTPRCADCNRVWESEWAFVNRDGTPRIA